MRKKRILVVDDSSDHREIIRRSFQAIQLGYSVEVEEAKNVESAREFLKAHSMDLVIVDWKLPDAAGTELLPGYDQEPSLPMIIMTSYGNDQVAVDALKKGAIDYIFKSDESLGQMPYIVDRALRVWELRQRSRLIQSKLSSTHRMAELGYLATSTISHELANLIGAITNYGTAIRLDIRALNIPPTTIQRTEKLLECAKKCAEIIRNFRKFSKARRLPPKVFDVEEKVRDRIDLLKPLIPGNISIEVSFSGTERFCLADPEQFSSMITNLITNACDAIGDRAGIIKVLMDTLRLETAETLAPDLIFGPGAYHRIRVSDNGKGIPKEEVAQVFEPFFTRKAGGTGTGLAAAKHFVDTLDGGIWVESARGAGALFTIVLPVTSALPPSPHPEFEFTYKGNGEHIVFVDDEAWFLDSTADLIEKLNYKVTTFRDPQKALDYICANLSQISLLLLDQTMPVMTGSELLRRVHEKAPGIKAILVTGYGGNMANEQQAKRVGFQRYLEKPVEDRELAEAIFETIGGGR